LLEPMKYSVIVAACLVIAGCQNPQQNSSTLTTAVFAPAGPFDGTDLQSISKDKRQIIIEASEDFQAVLSGKPPKHAKEDSNADLPADGGTSFYVGKGYSLTIVKSLSSFGGLNGFIYGPTIRFDTNFAPGNLSYVSNLRFYTDEKLRLLLVHK